MSSGYFFEPVHLVLQSKNDDEFYKKMKKEIHFEGI